MNVGNTDVAVETLQMNRRSLGAAREVLEANVGISSIPVVRPSGSQPVSISDEVIGVG